MLFCLKFWARCYIFIYTHLWKLICSLGIHCSSSLLFMMKLMVWHIVEWQLWGHDCTLSSATFKVSFFSFFLKFHEYGCMSCHWYFDWIMWVCATVSQGMKWSQISHATCKVEFTWREVCTSKATSGCVLFCISWELCFLWLKSFFICTSVSILCPWMMTEYGLQLTCRTTSSCWHLDSYPGETEMIVWSLSLFQSFWSASSFGCYHYQAFCVWGCVLATSGVNALHLLCTFIEVVFVTMFLPTLNFVILVLLLLELTQ